MSKPKIKFVHHFFFLLSPLLLLLLLVISTLIDKSTVVDILFSLTKAYAVIFLIISSLITYMDPKIELSPAKEVFIKLSYPTSSTIYFAYIFLVPLMRNMGGIWEDQVISMLIAFPISILVNFSLVGLYKVIALIFTKKAHP